MNTRNILSSIAFVSAIAAAAAFTMSSAQGQGCCAGMSAQHEGHQGHSHGTEATAATVKKGVQYATIQADGGYKPSTITAKAGMPLELTFTLGKKPGCASTVSFPGLKIKKSIPSGKGVVIKFTPAKVGEVPFECGMGMYKGKIIVK